MTECQICGEEYKKTGGNFYRHIKNAHSMTKEEYVIETKYDGEPPKCKCGLCDETPKFHRYSFRDYAEGHKSHQWKKKKYLELYGPPTCDYEECENEVEFRRGEPKKYCSHRCAGKDNGGFTQESTQEKIKRVCKEKYGTETPSKLEEAKQKISKKNKGNKPFADKTDKEMEEIKSKISESSVERWKDPEYKERTLNSIVSSLSDPYSRSKFHREARQQLSLDQQGFESEVVVDKYVVDELNEEKKEIIEFYGDYVHANPEEFSADDVIRLPGNSYTAQEKWDHDQEKIKYLENKGYDVTVIWESEFKEDSETVT